MDKSFIIRIYQQDNDAINGVVERIDLNDRCGFSSAKELWSLITCNESLLRAGNVIDMNAFKSTRNC